MGELKLYGVGVIFITTFSLFHFFRNSQKREALLLRNSSQNVNGSGFVTCQYPQITKKLLQKNFILVLTVTGVLEKNVMLASYFKLVM